MASLAFYKYLQVKDNYCIKYSGNNLQKAKELIEVRDILQSKFPYIKIYLCFADELNLELENAFPLSRISEYTYKISYFRELTNQDDPKDLLEK